MTICKGHWYGIRILNTHWANYSVFFVFVNCHFEDPDDWWVVARFEQWTLSDITNTWDKFCHIHSIRSLGHFVNGFDALLTLQIIACITCCIRMKGWWNIIRQFGWMYVAWSVFLVRFLLLVFCRTLLLGFVACVLTVQLLSALLLVSSDPVIMKLIS
jgi:hypothetical protein